MIRPFQILLAWLQQMEIRYGDSGRFQRFNFRSKTICFGDSFGNCLLSCALLRCISLRSGCPSGILRARTRSASAEALAAASCAARCLAATRSEAAFRAAFSARARSASASAAILCDSMNQLATTALSAFLTSNSHLVHKLSAAVNGAAQIPWRIILSRHLTYLE